MASTINPLGGATAAGETADRTKSQTTQEVSKEAFPQLLVAQIKNQNPLNPTDGVQFLTQLAQFSELEQLIGIKGELSNLHETLKPPASSTGGGAEENSGNAV